MPKSLFERRLETKISNIIIKHENTDKTAQKTDKFLTT